MARILIIDDDAAFLKMLHQVLERAGHMVTKALNGKIGVNLFREEQAELVITDIVLPEKEGLEIIQELKRDFPAVRIIAISGGGRRGEPLYLEMAKKFGADRVFMKPFERQELLSAIDELLLAR
jgi:DNA-binding response OmpR family regulator